MIGFGASPYSVSDGHLVRRVQLDEVCPDKPLFLVKYDGHACVVNTVLLNEVRGKVQHLRGFHEDTGEMNQEAFFAVSDYITASLSTVQLVAHMQKALDDLAARGIGMIHTVSGVGFARDLDVDLERFFARGITNGMQMRVFMQTLDVNKAVKRKLPRIGGCFETALDGCFGSMDAALLSPYENTSDCGVLYYSDEKVTEFCKAANRAGRRSGCTRSAIRRLCRRCVPSRRRLTICPEKITDIRSSMHVCRLRRRLRSVSGITSIWQCRRRSLTGRRSRTAIWSRSSESVRAG